MRASKRFVAAAVAFALVAGRSAQAVITTTGNVTGGGTPYAGQDPWNTQNLIVGDTAPGSMSITGGSVVNDTGTNAVIAANSTAASTSTVTVEGAGSNWISTFLAIGVRGTGTLNITGGGSVSSQACTIGLRPPAAAEATAR